MVLKDIIATLAPTLATALDGPLVGTAVKVLAEKFVGKPDASEEEVLNAVSTATPEQLVKLKEIEADFKTQMKKLDIDVYKLSVEDTNSARQLFSVNMWPQIILSAFYTLGYFGLLFCFFTGKISVGPALEGMANGLLLVLTTAQTVILHFWFGSTTGSKNKDAVLANIQS